jgi:hypothetical protein
MPGPYSFLFSRRQQEELVASYVLREHAAGRDLHAILADPYVRNRCTPEEVDRLLDRPEIVHAIGEDLISAVRTALLQAG